VGYRGKLEEQDKARRTRADGRTLADIAAALGVSKSSVSLWVRDVEFTPSPRRTGAHRRPHPFHEAKLRQIEELDQAARRRIGTLGDDAFLAAGIALYAGGGSKTDGAVMFANSDPAMIAFFCRWFRRFFDVDEQRLRVRIYLHEGLDLAAAQKFWAELTGIPPRQFIQPYRAFADQTRRRNKHEHGCAYVSYSCTRTHRAVMGRVRALLSTDAIPG
jgi:AcrR family transcriptional regulator